MQRFLSFPLVRLVLGLLLILPAYLGLQVLTERLTASLPKAVRQIYTSPLSALFVTVMVVLLYRLYYRLLEKKNGQEFDRKDALLNLCRGSGLTALFSVVIMGVLLISHHFAIERLVSWVYLPKVLAFSIMSATVEEIVFRGLLFRLSEEKMGSVFAITVSCLLFGLAHFANPHATIAGAFAIGLEAGLALSALYMLTRTLWLPIAAHATWNFLQGTLSLPVSGTPIRGVFDSRLLGDPFWTGGEFGIEFSALTVGLGIFVGMGLLYAAYCGQRFVKPFWVKS